VIAGVASYILLNGIPRLLSIISGGRLAPPDLDLAERWAPRGSLEPPILRMFRARVASPEPPTELPADIGIPMYARTDLSASKADAEIHAAEVRYSMEEGVPVAPPSTPRDDVESAWSSRSSLSEV
jgi:hypothetical protein